MKYLSDKSKIRRNSYRNATLFFIACVAFVYFWQPIRATLYPVIEPVIRTYGGTKGVASFIPEFFSTYFSTRSELATRNSDLEVSIERLENQLAENNALLREREALIGSSSAEVDSSVVVMYPIMEDVTKLYSTIILSKGYRDGIEVGGLVYVRGLQPACEIIEVYDRTSLCELFSKGNKMTEGVTASSSITLTLTGNGGGNYIGATVKGSLVYVGEQVYLRSNPAFTLGTIVQVQEDDQDTGAKVYIRGAYNPVSSSIFYLNTRYAP